MKKKIAITTIFIIFNSFLLIGCATPPRPEPPYITNSEVVNKPFDVVWTQLIEYLSSRQIQLKTINKESGFLDTEFMLLPAQILPNYAWTGRNLPSMLHNKGRIKANIFVKKISESKTSVTINAWVQVFEEYIGKYSPGGWMAAKSTGKFESDILNTLR
jgi:hypothetical protein